MKHPVKQEVKHTILFLTAAAAFVLSIRYAAQAKEGIAAATEVCVAVLVPSLFPMLILSRFAASCPCPTWLQRLSAKPLRALFGLSPGCAAPLLLGLTGGYPLAAKTASAAKDEGLISPEDARRLTLFFTCPGLPFAVVAAGCGCFQSRAVGGTLFASCALADLLTAALYHRFSKRPALSAAVPGKSPAAAPLADRLVAAVDGAVRAMLSVCAWIAAFYALLRITEGLTGACAAALLTPAAEVTAALTAAAERKDLPMTAACLAFGGLCVWCQLLPDLRKNGVGSGRYLAVRAVCAGSACGAEALLMRLAAIPVPTETRIGNAYLSADSAAGAVGLLILCAVFMADTAGKNRREG